MNIENPVKERNILRCRWRSVRDERLALKKSLSGIGKTIIEIRHERDYRRLKKKQKILSRMIRHIEKKIRPWHEQER